MNDRADSAPVIWRHRALLFAVALVARGVPAWIFFGSVDVTNAMLNAIRLASGVAPSAIPVPYFPGIYELLIATSASLASHTALPLTFCFKLFPIVFDGVLAVLIYDFVMPLPRAFQAGLLYALSPVSIMITAIHTQWDAMAIAFLVLSLLLASRPSNADAAFAGAAFVLSILIKPVAIPFLPLIFPSPMRIVSRRTAAMVASISICAAVYLSALYAVGDPLTLSSVRQIFRYAAHGAQIHGLPIVLGTATANRLVSLTPLLLLVALYWAGFIRREMAVLLAFAAVIGTSGIGPQYLLWMVPFFLICGKERYAALYNLLAGSFLVIFYQQPGLDGLNVENLGAFGPLKPLAWLAPDASFMNAKIFLAGLLGHLIIPIAALAFFLLELLKVSGQARYEGPAPPLALRRILAPAMCAIAVVAIPMLVASWWPRPTSAGLERALHNRTAEYAIYRYQGPGLVNPDEPTWVIAAYAREPVRASVIDAASIGYAWVVIWSVAAWAAAKRTPDYEPAA